LAENATLPPRDLRTAALYAPWGNAMAKLRTCLSFLTHFDNEVMDHSFAADHRKAVRIMARMAAIVAAIERIRSGREPVDPAAVRAQSLAELFLGADRRKASDLTP
jgi:citrate synthase